MQKGGKRNLKKWYKKKQMFKMTERKTEEWKRTRKNKERENEIY